MNLYLNEEGHLFDLTGKFVGALVQEFYPESIDERITLVPAADMEIPKNQDFIISLPSGTRGGVQYYEEADNPLPF
jgi:hypothetical protein